VPFTQDQINRLGSSFQIIEPRLDDVVFAFYTKLFDEAPSLRSMFPQDMGGQKKHMNSALKLVANNIDNLENLAEPLREMGARHIAYGAEEAQFPVVRDVMVASLAEVAGYTWTPQLSSDWGEALDAVAGYMIEGMRGAQTKAA
jgi:hemoglobin-like flavoprotein